MCNLYRMTKPIDEVAKLFAVENALTGSNMGEEVFPGYPGAVIADGALRSMIWGFPLVLKSKKTGKPLKPKPVNNARTDKLDSYMWRYSFEERRCLIPLTEWAEAEGAKGSMTRTWLSARDAEVFCVAGIWRNSDEWGPCYSMVMTDSAGDAAQVHSRMPVILTPETSQTWTNGSHREARGLCAPQPWDINIGRTGEPWFRKS